VTGDGDSWVRVYRGSTSTVRFQVENNCDDGYESYEGDSCRRR